MTSLALVSDLRCSGCNAGVAETEEGRCAHCRMLDRGDDRLVTHDSRGWEGERRPRVLCGCGCGMTQVPVVEEPKYQPPTRLSGLRPVASPWGREEIIAAMHAWKERYGTQPTTAAWNKVAGEHPSSHRVQVVFGTWNAGIAAAGFVAKTTGRERGGWLPKPIVPRGIHGR